MIGKEIVIPLYLWLHLEQSSERMILYRVHAAAIFSPVPSLHMESTVLHDNGLFAYTECFG